MNALAGPKVVQLDATFSSAIADNLNHIRHDVHLHWLVLVVPTVIVGIDQTLFQCLIGIVVHYYRMFVIIWFVDILAHHHILQVFQCPPQCKMYRSTERLCLRKVVGVAILALRIEHDVNLRTGEELLRVVREHHQGHVLDARLLHGAFQQVHLFHHLHGCQLLHLPCQRALGLCQIVAYQQHRDILGFCLHVATVVKRHAVGQIQQFRQIVILGHNAAGVVAYVIVVFFLFGCHHIRHLVRATFSSRHPYHHHSLSIHRFEEHARLIVRRNQVVEPYHSLLYRFNLVDVNALNRTNSPSVHFVHTHDDIPSARIVKVISESADGPVDRVRIPPFLVFHSVALHHEATQQIFYVNW